MSEEQSSFFSILFRQKHIRRWGLMHSVMPENLTEHSAETADLAHALAVIGNTYFGKQYDTGRVTELALFHDAPEVYTGDLPTPVKYFSPQMRESYAAIEDKAIDTLLGKLPPAMRPVYESLLRARPEDEELHKLVKAADKLSAYLKALSEEKAGNPEFARARLASEKALDAMDCPELAFFRAHFLSSFGMTLDEIQD